MMTATRTTAIQAGGIQLAATTGGALAAWPFGTSIAVAIVVGGGIALLGHAIVTAMAYRAYRADRPEMVGQSLMFAEMGRLLSVGVAFALVFANGVDVWLPGLFGSFLLIHLVPAWWIHRNTN